MTTLFPLPIKLPRDIESPSTFVKTKERKIEADPFCFTKSSGTTSSGISHGADVVVVGTVEKRGDLVADLGNENDPWY